MVKIICYMISILDNVILSLLQDVCLLPSLMSTPGEKKEQEIKLQNVPLPI